MIFTGYMTCICQFFNRIFKLFWGVISNRNNTHVCFSLEVNVIQLEMDCLYNK